MTPAAAAVLLLVLLIVGARPSAASTLQLLEDLRSVVVADLSGEVQTVRPDPPFSRFDVDLELASQSTLILPGVFQGNGAARLDPALGRGLSEASIRFDLAGGRTQYGLELRSLYDGARDRVAEGVVRLVEVDEGGAIGDTVFQNRFLEAELEVRRIGSLAPGRYLFELYAEPSLQEDDAAEVTFDYRFVLSAPEPGAAAAALAIVLGLACSARRIRRSHGPQHARCRGRDRRGPGAKAAGGPAPGPRRAAARVPGVGLGQRHLSPR